MGAGNPEMERACPTECADSARATSHVALPSNPPPSRRLHRSRIAHGDRLAHILRATRDSCVRLTPPSLAHRVKGGRQSQSTYLPSSGWSPQTQRPIDSSLSRLDRKVGSWLTWHSS